MLAPQQYLAIELLANLAEPKNYTEVAELVNINRSTLWRWLNDNVEFQEELKAATLRALQAVEWEAAKELVVLVRKGHFKAIELYLRMRGLYLPSEARANLNVRVDANRQEMLESKSKKELVEFVIKELMEGGISPNDLKAIAERIKSVQPPSSPERSEDENQRRIEYDGELPNADTETDTE